MTLKLLLPPEGEPPRKLGKGEIVHGAAPLFAQDEDAALRKMMTAVGERFEAQLNSAFFGGPVPAVTVNGVTYVTFKRGGR